MTANDVSRRSFLKGAAVVSGSMALAASALGCSPESTSNENSFPDDSPTGNANSVNTADAKWSFEIPPDPISDEEISEIKQADVVVVGGGTSGLVSALSCLENGLSVILISASSVPSYRGGSINGVYSKCMEEC